MLTYLDCLKSFTLENDVSIRRLVAELSQAQKDNQLRPIAYASRSLSAVEKKDVITELETLAVILAINRTCTVTMLQSTLITPL